VYRHENATETGRLAGRPPLQSPRLLAQVRERLRYLQYSYRTEQTYVYWTRFFVHFHGLKHPRELGKGEVEAFLTMLATERKVSVSTHRQALSALLFRHRDAVCAGDPGWSAGMTLLNLLRARVASRRVRVERHARPPHRAGRKLTTLVPAM
jgi:hypothetical protein